ncbi:UNVERIFIED_CONTAM: Haloacid dehalogenase-like hydrolase domain-containing protein Sgpp [Sesamum latifolium]|uniref:Haloacid dehalogenase-like hydrolase domain-containing protein Sgpp n=1 Tax=Sesamum latifolium TaxID=2727402 RepID=A0AAW2WWT0_9LAMI
MAISSVDNSPASLDSGGSLSQIAPLEAVLFDIDGTLCDTDPLHYTAFREMLMEIGFNGGVPITEEFFIANIAGKHNEDIASVLFPNDHERDRGLKRAAVTNAPRENAELMISLLRLSDFFHAVILGSDCERAKPSPDPYLKALEVLKVSKEHTCVFEDSVSGIKAGVAAGIPTVGLTTRNPAELLTQAKPAFLIKDYEDPKLWTALDELDKMGKVKTGAA